jgi:Txe/YoeB family toxin of toxin-antitoxin system
LTKSARSLEFDSAALDDLTWCVQQDRKKALRILRLIQETAADPFGGIGKPEPLKHELAGVLRMSSSTLWYIAAEKNLQLL